MHGLGEGGMKERVKNREGEDKGIVSLRERGKGMGW